MNAEVHSLPISLLILILKTFIESYHRISLNNKLPILNTITMHVLICSAAMRCVSCRDGGVQDKEVYGAFTCHLQNAQRFLRSLQQKAGGNARRQQVAAMGGRIGEIRGTARTR